MALEDLAMFRSIPTATVFYPSDAVSTEKAVELAANTKVGHMAVRDMGVGSACRRSAGHSLPHSVSPTLPLVFVAGRS